MSRTTKIEVKESVDELLALMNAQTLADKRVKIQTLYLLRSQQCQQIKQIASIVGKNRKTIHQWLSKYQQEGLHSLINTTRKKPGRKCKIPNWAIDKLRERLSQANSFHNYQEIRDWLESECHIKADYHVVQKLICYRLQVKIGSPHD